MLKKFIPMSLFKGEILLKELGIKVEKYFTET